MRRRKTYRFGSWGWLHLICLVSEYECENWCSEAQLSKQTHVRLTWYEWNRKFGILHLWRPFLSEIQVIDCFGSPFHLSSIMLRFILPIFCFLLPGLSACGKPWQCDLVRTNPDTTISSKWMKKSSMWWTHESSVEGMRIVLVELHTNSNKCLTGHNHECSLFAA